MWHPHPEAVTHWLRTIALGGIILLKEICHWWWAWRRCSLSPLPALSASCVWIRCDLWATVAAAAVKLLCRHRLSLRNQMTSFFSKLIMVTVVYHPTTTTKKKMTGIFSKRKFSRKLCFLHCVWLQLTWCQGSYWGLGYVRQALYQLSDLSSLWTKILPELAKPM